MSGFDALAKKLESLGGVTSVSVGEGARFAQDIIMKEGRDGGPLRGGNSAAASVQQQGLSLVITRIHSTKGGFPYGIRNDFLAVWIAKRIEREIQRRMGK